MTPGDALARAEALLTFLEEQTGLVTPSRARVPENVSCVNNPLDTVRHVRHR